MTHFKLSPEDHRDSLKAGTDGNQATAIQAVLYQNVKLGCGAQLHSEHAVLINMQEACIKHSYLSIFYCKEEVQNEVIQWLNMMNSTAEPSTYPFRE